MFRVFTKACDAKDEINIKSNKKANIAKKKSKMRVYTLSYVIKKILSAVTRLQTYPVARERFLNKGGRGAENIKYKFRFAPKLPGICINQKCSMGARFCTFFSY